MRSSAESANNLSRMSQDYNRQKRGRIVEAQQRDPTAYTLYKRGINGAQIQCDCGSWLTNTKRARYYHSTKHAGHQSWLQNRQNQVRLQGSYAPTFLSILTRHSPNMHHMLLGMMVKMMLLGTMVKLRYVCICMVLLLRLF
jgi:hypothetical protein